MFSTEELKNLLPSKKRGLVTEDMVKTINTVATDPLISEEFKTNFITYNTIISNGKYSLEEYNNAIHFLTLILLEHSDIDAYEIVFPERYLRLKTRGVTRSKMSSYVSNYKGTILVTQLLEQSLVPTYLVNAPKLQAAINHTEFLMLNAKSETVQQKAAETLITNLKAPEAAKLEVDISINKGEVVDDYEAVMREVAKKKREAILAGADIKEIANISSGVKEMIETEVLVEIEESVEIILEEEEV